MNARDLQRLMALNPCNEAVEWAKGYPTLDAAWAACERPDWLLWWIGATVAQEPDSLGRRWLVLLAAEFAGAVPQVGARAEAVDLAARWGAGDPHVTLEMLVAASDAASAAAWAAASDAASAAAWAARAAAWAASDAERAAAWAARAAASAAVWAASDAARAAASDAAWAAQCTAIRALFPTVPV